MKKYPYRNSDQAGKGSTGPQNPKAESVPDVNPDQEKHDHYKQVKHKLESLQKDLEHGKAKGWDPQDVYDEFKAANEKSLAYVNSKLPA